MPDRIDIDIGPGDLGPLERALLNVADKVAERIARGVGGELGGALTPGPGGGTLDALPATPGGMAAVLAKLGTERFGAAARGSFAGQAAEALGGAAAVKAVGVAGAVATVVKIVTEKLQEIVAIPGQKIGAALSGVARGMKDLQGTTGVVGTSLSALGSFGESISDFGKKLTLISPAASVALVAIGSTIANVAGPLKDVLEGMAELAGKTNPAVVERLKIAVDDSAAVLGRIFIPVIEAITKSVRLFGDFLATILPTTNEMRAVFSELNPVFDELRRLAIDLAPAFRELVRLLAGDLVIALKFVAANVKIISTLIRTSPIGLISRGLGLGGQQQLADSFGAAARQGQFFNVEELGRQMQLAAVASGAPDIPQQQLTTQQEILRTVQTAAAQLATTAITTPFIAARMALDALLRR